MGAAYTYSKKKPDADAAIGSEEKGDFRKRAPLRLQPEQKRLTRSQKAAARRFAEERIASQLSTAPIDEAEAEAWLRQAYQVAGLAPPRIILWLDGPLSFCPLLMEGSGLPDRAQASSV